VTTTPAEKGGEYTLITEHDPTYYNGAGKGGTNNMCVDCEAGNSGNSTNINGYQGIGYSTGGGGGCGNYGQAGTGGAGGIGYVAFGYTIIE
jgi:hypothetical protein